MKDLLWVKGKTSKVRVRSSREQRARGEEQAQRGERQGGDSRGHDEALPKPLKTAGRRRSISTRVQRGLTFKLPPDPNPEMPRIVGELESTCELSVREKHQRAIRPLGLKSPTKSSKLSAFTAYVLSASAELDEMMEASAKKEKALADARATAHAAALERRLSEHGRTEINRRVALGGPSLATRAAVGRRAGASIVSSSPRHASRSTVGGVARGTMPLLRVGLCVRSWARGGRESDGRQGADSSQRWVCVRTWGVWGAGLLREIDRYDGVRVSVCCGRQCVAQSAGVAPGLGQA